MSDDALVEELRRAADTGPRSDDLDLRFADQREALRFSLVVKVPERPDVVARVDALARAHGTTRAAIVREAIRAFLDRQEDPRGTP